MALIKSTNLHPFTVVLSMANVLPPGFLTLRLREYMFRLFMSVLMLLGTLVLPVRFGPGRGILLADMVCLKIV